MEEGLVETRTHEKGSDQQIDGSVEGKIPLIGGAQVSAKEIWRKTESETRVLHDHMFNHVERKLQDNPSFIDINKVFGDASWDRKLVPTKIGATSFIRAKGKVRINDFSYMAKLMHDFHRMAAIIASFNAIGQSEGKTKKDKARLRRQAEDSMNLPDKKVIDNVAEMFERFYGASVTIKVWPLPNATDCVFVCRLNKSYLRDSIEDLNFKFGANPEDDWVLIAQIARIPNQDHSHFSDPTSVSSDDINKAVEKMFDASAFFVDVASVKYPYISVTPLAIYRE
jgi:hypothetical protein